MIFGMVLGKRGFEFGGTVSAPTPPTETLSNAQWGASYNDTADISSLGAGPYTVTGLPYGMTYTIAAGVITVTGTPA